MIENIFKYTKANTAKLIEYGFKKADNVYRFETTIVDGQFKLLVNITANGDISTKTVDINSQDEYVLHLIDGAEGEFVGKVRAEFERVLTDIKVKCFEKEIFKSEQTKQVIEYIRKKFGDELEFLWKKLPTGAVWRRKDNSKWYGIILVIQKNKLGIKSDELVEIIDLRIEPDKIQSTVDNEHYFAGYHMNKKNWFTICLDNSVPAEIIFDRIDKSYNIALKK